MITRGSVRRKGKKFFQKVIKLRKKGLSYTEIQKETGIAKSTINNWLTFAGLTLTKEHREISRKKYLANNLIATEASKITRAKRKDEDIQNFITKHKQNFEDPLFNYCIALFEAEGSKSIDCKFSNSDYRLIKLFILFTERYLLLDKINNISYSLYIHESRKDDLNKILNFWVNKLGIPKTKIYIYWKKNIVTHRRNNPDYTGQIGLRIMGEKVLGSKLLAISDIILSQYQK